MSIFAYLKCEKMISEMSMAAKEMLSPTVSNIRPDSATLSFFWGKKIYISTIIIMKIKRVKQYG